MPATGRAAGPAGGAEDAPPRRILLATNHLRVGGAEVQLVHLARALVGRGDEVRLLSLLPTLAFQAEMAALGIPIIHAPYRRLRSWGFIRFAVRTMREWRPDAVVSFLYQANVVCRVAARMAGVPVVVSSFRNERFGRRGRELVLRVTDRLATMSTTNSRVVADRLVARQVVPAKRIVIVPNGIDVSPFEAASGRREEIRARLGAGDAFVWLAVGKLEPQKDFANLLRAFAGHIRHNRNAVLWLAGDGSLRTPLERDAATLGLGPAVRFLGIRDDVPVLLAGCDGFVQSSAWEGLPNVVMEAMAAGRPVVATNAGGTAELVRHGSTGMLVEPEDSGTLAVAMDELAAAAPDERQRMGEAGRRLVEERFGVDAATAAWMRLIDGFMCGPVPSMPSAAPADTEKTASGAG